MKPCPLCSAEQSRHEREVNGYPLIRCGQCGFVYADIAQETIDRFNASFDEETAEKYRQMQTVLDEVWFAGVAARFTRQLGAGRVLDIGCGNGQLLRQFKARGWDCHGIDLSPWTEEFARAYGFRFSQGRIEDFREQDDFDLVVSSSTLEHVSQPIPFLAETARFLKRGGIAYFCGIPNYDSLARLLEIANFSHNNPPWHVSFFTPRTARLTIARTAIPWSEARVETYGIPELNRVYDWIKSLRKREKREADPPRLEAKPSRKRQALMKGALWLHYHAGRPFGLGDKIEIVLIR